MRDQKLKFLVVDALFAVIIALLAQVAIPLGPIPLTGQTFAIGLGLQPFLELVMVQYLF